MILYNTTDKPRETGVYACAIEESTYPYSKKDLFLIWYKGRWERVKSDQPFRDKVLGWIGPLSRYT